MFFAVLEVTPHIPRVIVSLTKKNGAWILLVEVILNKTKTKVIGTKHSIWA